MRRVRSSGEVPVATPIVITRPLMPMVTLQRVDGYAAHPCYALSRQRYASHTHRPVSQCLTIAPTDFDFRFTPSLIIFALLPTPFAFTIFSISLPLRVYTRTPCLMPRCLPQPRYDACLPSSAAVFDAAGLLGDDDRGR